MNSIQLEEEARESRKSIAERVSSGAIIDEDRAILEGLITKFGVNGSEGWDGDSLMEELLTIRRAQDLLKGRHDAIRGSMFSYFDTKYGEGEAAELLSEEHGHKFVRVRSGGKASVEYKLFLEEFGPETSQKFFDEIRTETVQYLNGVEDSRKETIQHVLKEAVLEQALRDDQIDTDRLASAIVHGPTKFAFRVDAA